MTENNVAEPLLIGEAVIVTRNRELISAPVHDEIVMMDIDSGRYYGLDDIGSVIWRRVESPQTFGALIDSLVAEYDADRGVIAADVSKLLVLMAEHKVIDLA